jgi:sugar lactone lactonase YvrE
MSLVGCGDGRRVRAVRSGSRREVGLQGGNVIAPKVWATGLSTVQGCGFGPDGAFYATEFQVAGLNEAPGANPAGDVVRIDRHGQRTHLGVGKLFFPSGFAAGSDGAIYVSNCSIAPAGGMGPQLCPTGGQVVRIR